MLKVQWKVILVLVVLAIACYVMYSPVLHADYVWDDTLLFVSKTSLLNQPLSWALISEPVLPGTTYFRPLVFLSWYAEFKLFGQSATISHIIGLVVFYFNICLVFGLGSLLAKRTNHTCPLFVGSMAGLIYLFHPALIESSAWVSGRFDQFATLFILLGCFIFLATYKYKKIFAMLPSLLISICFLFALLSKELGIILPLILLCFYLALGLQHQSSKVNLLKAGFINYKTLYISLAITLVLYIMLRLSAMPQLYHEHFSANYAEYAIIKNWVPLQALKFYILQTFLPFSHVNLLHPMDEMDFEGAYSRITALASGLSLVLVIWFAWVKRSVAAWLLLAAVVSILPVLYLIPLSIANNIGHERFMTLGIAFVAIAASIIPYVHILIPFGIKRKLSRLIVALIAIVWLGLSCLTIKSVLPFWHNDFSLWTWAYRSHPDSAIARYNYLYGAMLLKKYQLVIDECEKYIKQHGGLEVADQSMYASALTNLKNPEGLNYFQGVMAALPKFHESKDKDARKRADMFLMTAAQMGGVYSSYGNALLMFKGDIEGALVNLKAADWYMLPDQKEDIRYYIAAALYANKQYDQAHTLYRQQLKISQKNRSRAFTATYQILDVYCQSGREELEVCIKFRQDKLFIQSNKLI